MFFSFFILLYGSLILDLVEYSPCFPFTVQTILVLEGIIRIPNEKETAPSVAVPIEDQGDALPGLTYGNCKSRVCFGSSSGSACKGQVGFWARPLSLELAPFRG